MDSIKAFFACPDEDHWEALIADEQVIWVDWREYDEDIVQYCEAVLQTGSLEALTADSGEGTNPSFTIRFRGQETLVRYPGEGSDRDTTIATLNQVIAPDYELRFVEKSLGSDTLAFVPLAASVWKELEDEFGCARVRQDFSQIQPGRRMFGLTMDEVMDILETREQNT